MRLLVRWSILQAVLVGTSLTAQAAVLTFDGTICSPAIDGGGSVIGCTGGGYIHQDYGDSSNVNITYQAGTTPGLTMQRWDTGYSDLTNVAYGFFGAGTASILLTPLGGGQLTLNSFALGSAGGLNRNATVDIIDLGTNLSVFSQALTVGATASVLNPGVSSTAGFRLSYSGDVFNLGIDNVSFDVAPASSVPEPATAGMVALALLAGMAHRTRLLRRRAGR